MQDWVHVANPDGDGPFPVIVFFHHGPGLDDSSKQLVRMIVDHGYFVAAIDRYHRFEPWVSFDLARSTTRSRQPRASPDDEDALRHHRRPRRGGRLGAARRPAGRSGALSRRHGLHRLLHRRSLGAADDGQPPRPVPRRCRPPSVVLRDRRSRLAAPRGAVAARAPLHRHRRGRPDAVGRDEPPAHRGGRGARRPWHRRDPPGRGPRLRGARLAVVPRGCGVPLVRPRVRDLRGALGR